MKKSLVRVLGVLFIVHLTSPAIAAPAEAEAMCRLLPPPAPGSEAFDRDLRALHELQQKRTPEQCAVARREKQVSLRSWFGPETGVLSEAELRRATPAALQVFAVAGAWSAVCKRHFRRIRPYVQDRSLQPCIEPPKVEDLSYPSGHAAVSFALSHMLARMFPHKAERILKQGFGIGENRALAGVHFPSDVEAGRILSKGVLQQLGIAPFGER